jgi:outer membrane biosynthesis protein TonB
VDITDTTQFAETKWPLWAWCVGAAFAIVIGGGLGNWVGSRNAESAQAEPQAQGQASQPTVTPIVEPPQTTTGNVADRTAQPDPQIEIEPQSVRPAAAPAVRRATTKQKPTPSKSRRCNVYDHMDGC